MTQNAKRFLYLATAFLCVCAPSYTFFFIGVANDFANDNRDSNSYISSETKRKVKKKCDSCGGLGYIRNANANSLADVTYECCRFCKGSGTIILWVDEVKPKEKRKCGTKL